MSAMSEWAKSCISENEAYFNTIENDTIMTNMPILGGQLVVVYDSVKVSDGGVYYGEVRELEERKGDGMMFIRSMFSEWVDMCEIGQIMCVTDHCPENGYAHVIMVRYDGNGPTDDIFCLEFTFADEPGHGMVCLRTLIGGKPWNGHQSRFRLVY
jgi:hypothetical protein